MIDRPLHGSRTLGAVLAAALGQAGGPHWFQHWFGCIVQGLECSCHCTLEKEETIILMSVGLCVCVCGGCIVVILLLCNNTLKGYISNVKFVLFNDATGTHLFLSYHQLLDVIHMVKLTHFLEGNPLPPHRLLFSISSKGIFYMHFSIDRTVHTTAFDKPVVDHWLERKIAQTAAGSTEKDRSDERPLQRRARYRLSYIPLRIYQCQKMAHYNFH